MTDGVLASTPEMSAPAIAPVILDQLVGAGNTNQMPVRPTGDG